LRAIIGLPGGAQLGPPLSLPFTVDEARVSPQSDFAIAVGTERGTNLRPIGTLRQPKEVWVVNGLSTGSPTAAKLDGVTADAVVLNATGSAALLYSARTRSIQFLTSLPAQPKPSAPVSIQAIGGAVTSMALSSDGATAVIGVSSLENGGVYMLSATASAPSLLTATANPVALELYNHDNDLIVADAAASRVFTVKSIHAVPGPQPLIGSEAGLKKPAGVRVTGDRNLFIADGGANAVFEMDLVTGTVTGQIAASAAPVRLDALSLPDAFALTEAGTSQLLLLDTSQGQASVLFVPSN